MGLPGLLQCVYLVLVLAECGVTSLFSYGSPKKCDTRWKYYQTLSGCPGLDGVCRMCDYDKRGKAYGEQECIDKHSNDVQLYGKNKTRWCGNTGPIPTCDFPTITNGHTTCDGELNRYEKKPWKMYPDTVCSFTCDPGFELIGSKSVKCKDVPRRRLTINATLPRCVGNGRSQTTMAGHDYDLADITTSSVWEKTHDSAVAEMAELTTAVTEMAEITTAAVTEIPDNRPSSTAGDAGKKFPNTDNASNPKLGANETEFAEKFINISRFQDKGNPTSHGSNLSIILGSVGGIGVTAVLVFVVYRLKCKAKPGYNSDEECAVKDTLTSEESSADSSMSSNATDQKRYSSDAQSDSPLLVDKSEVDDERPSEPGTGQTGHQMQIESVRHVQSENPVCKSGAHMIDPISSGQSRDVGTPQTPPPHSSASSERRPSDSGGQQQQPNYIDEPGWDQIDFIRPMNFNPIETNPECESLMSAPSIIIKEGRIPPVGQSLSSAT